jgi:hypothetical protein
MLTSHSVIETVLIHNHDLIAFLKKLKQKVGIVGAN